jgi:hypothetical protein
MCRPTVHRQYGYLRTYRYRDCGVSHSRMGFSSPLFFESEQSHPHFSATTRPSPEDSSIKMGAWGGCPDKNAAFIILLCPWHESWWHVTSPYEGFCTLTDCKQAWTCSLSSKYYCDRKWKICKPVPPVFFCMYVLELEMASTTISLIMQVWHIACWSSPVAQIAAVGGLGYTPWSCKRWVTSHKLLTVEWLLQLTQYKLLKLKMCGAAAALQVPAINQPFSIFMQTKCKQNLSKAELVFQRQTFPWKFPNNRPTKFAFHWHKA